MYKSFEVKSKVVGSYKVSFINDIKIQLTELTKNNGAIFVIDEKLFEFF